MRTRKHPFTFYMNEKELNYFNKQVGLSCLTKSEFLRQRIRNTDIRPRPPDEYSKIYKLLSSLANNVNQIAKLANATGYINHKQLDAAINWYARLIAL